MAGTGHGRVDRGVARAKEGNQRQGRMTSHRSISIVALTAAMVAASPAVASASSLLSGYGGPGQGSQAILGSALLGGGSGGGGGGGSGGGSSGGASGGSSGSFRYRRKPLVGLDPQRPARCAQAVDAARKSRGGLRPRAGRRRSDIRRRLGRIQLRRPKRRVARVRGVRRRWGCPARICCTYCWCSRHWRSPASSPGGWRGRTGPEDIGTAKGIGGRTRVSQVGTRTPSDHGPTTHNPADIDHAAAHRQAGARRAAPEVAAGRDLRRAPAVGAGGAGLERAASRCGLRAAVRCRRDHPRRRAGDPARLRCAGSAAGACRRWSCCCSICAGCIARACERSCSTASCPSISAVSIAAMAVATIGLLVNGHAPSESDGIRAWLFALLAVGLGACLPGRRPALGARAPAGWQAGADHGRGRRRLAGGPTAREPSRVRVGPGRLPRRRSPLGRGGGWSRRCRCWARSRISMRRRSETGVRKLIVAFSSVADARISRLIQRCQELGVEVSVVPRMFDTINNRVGYDTVGGLPLMSFTTRRSQGDAVRVKHAIDRVFALSCCSWRSRPAADMSALAVRL